MASNTRDTPPRLVGTVKWFSTIRGYGFLLGEDGAELFVHAVAIPRDHRDEGLTEGQVVSYSVGTSATGRLRAEHVQLEAVG